MLDMAFALITEYERKSWGSLLVISFKSPHVNHCYHFLFSSISNISYSASSAHLGSRVGWSGGEPSVNLSTIHRARSTPCVLSHWDLRCLLFLCHNLALPDWFSMSGVALRNDLNSPQWEKQSIIFQRDLYECLAWPFSQWFYISMPLGCNTHFILSAHFCCCCCSLFMLFPRKKTFERIL